VQSALEERVRKLEAQLAEAQSPTRQIYDSWENSHSMLDERTESVHQPSLRLDTSFIASSPRSRSLSMGDNLDMFDNYTTPTSSDVPVIEITAATCESPASIPVSPNPSLFSNFSATTRGSTPDPYWTVTASPMGDGNYMSSRRFASESKETYNRQM